MAKQILQRTDYLVVFGFAFNPYDEAVLELLKCAACNLRSVLLIDIAPKTERVRELWPKATITSCSPPPGGDAEIMRWLRSHDSVVSFGQS